MTTDDTLLTTEEVLRYLQLNLKTVYRLIRAGKLPAVRLGRQWRFRKRDLDAWLASTLQPADYPLPSGPRSVLVVDDDEGAREVIAAALSAAGYTVKVAADGPQALAIVAEHPVDVVLTDLKMPAMDGITLAEELRRLNPSLPIVILTAASTERAAIAAANLGVAGYLLKPYEWPKILQVVSRAVQGQNDRPASADRAT